MTGELIHTTEDAKSIFVLDTSKTLYVGKKKKGTFQHSSFLAGGVTAAAGRLIVETGILKVYFMINDLQILTWSVNDGFYPLFNRQFGLTAVIIGLQKKNFKTSFHSSEKTMWISQM
jgi:hypothetical protein